MSRSTEQFLVRAAAEFDGGGWLFTGFNWPVLAARLARRLGHDFVQVLEAGAALDRDTERLMTSTTDYYNIADAMCYRGSTADVMFSLVPRCRLVLIDAANVDLAGRTNTTSIGPWRTPKVRLPGGGGGPDAAFGASDLCLLHGGTNMQRIVARVEPITVSPASTSHVRLLSRWGTLTLGSQPRLDVLVDDEDEGSAFVKHLDGLGVDTGQFIVAEPPDPAALVDAEAVLDEAAAAGYISARTSKRSSDRS